MNLLVIEDHPSGGEQLCEALVGAKHSCLLASRARDAVERARKQRDDAIILSLSLREPALEVLKEVRGLGIRTPLIALASSGAMAKRIAALKAGADDCMLKPIATVELLARIEAVRRRTYDRPGNVLQAGSLSLDLCNRRLSCAQREISLTPAEFGIAELLLRHLGKPVLRETLAEHSGLSSRGRPGNVVQVHISRLRDKLEGVLQDFTITTIPRNGYALQPVSAAGQSKRPVRGAQAQLAEGGRHVHADPLALGSNPHMHTGIDTYAGFGGERTLPAGGAEGAPGGTPPPGGDDLRKALQPDSQ